MISKILQILGILPQMFSMIFFLIVNKTEQNITITYLLVFSFKTYSSFEIASCHIRLTMLAKESLLIGIGDSSTCIILLNDSGSNKFCKYVHTSSERIFSFMHIYNCSAFASIYCWCQFLFLVIYDLSFASTETKFKNPITKTQNNIVIFGFFHKKVIISFWLFLK